MVELALEAVSYRYPNGGVLALDGVTLRIGSGEQVALVGQNGSGKSTLIQHLNGLLRPTNGRVLHDGVDVAARRVAELARGVGLCFQDPDRQIFAGTVRAEVAFGPRMLGLRGRALDAAVDEALARTGLTDAARSNPYDLGSARRRRVALASVLAMGTPVVVLDEPTTGLDRGGVEIVERVVAETRRTGRTLIVISHDLEFVARSLDRVVVLRAGRVLLDGPPGTVFARDAWQALRSTYLEPPLAATIGDRLGLGSTPTPEAVLAALAGDLGAGGQ